MCSLQEKNTPKYPLQTWSKKMLDKEDTLSG